MNDNLRDEQVVEEGISALHSLIDKYFFSEG